MARMVQDVALMLGVCAGHDPRDPTSSQRPVPDYVAALGQERRLRHRAVHLPHERHRLPFEGYNPAAYEQALKDEFDQLYEAGATKRRMMVMALHDGISGHANRVRVLDRFFTYVKSKPGVWFARKDEIADWAKTRVQTPYLNRGPVQKTGLFGPSA